MPLWHVEFRASHDCPFCNVSKMYQSVRVFIWCNWENEVVELVAEDRKARQALAEELCSLTGVFETISEEGGLHLMAKRCSCTEQNSIAKNIDACNLLHLSPMVCEGGWEYYRIIAFRHGDLKELQVRLDKMGAVFEVLRKAPFEGFIASSMTLTADAMFSHLTEKQSGALVEAYAQGYYSMPRKADVKRIARKTHVPRATFQEHLRKAENKVLSSLIPYVRLFRHLPDERRRLQDEAASV